MVVTEIVMYLSQFYKLSLYGGYLTEKGSGKQSETRMRGKFMSEIKLHNYRCFGSVGVLNDKNI